MAALRTTTAPLRAALARTATAAVTSTSPSSSRLLSSSAFASKEKDPQLGDYPDLPHVSTQKRPDSKRWWDQQDKRNYGETLHEQDDALSVWAPDVHKMPANKAFFQFLTAAGCMSLFAYGIYLSKPERRALPRTYPREGLAVELGNKEIAAPADGAFDGQEEEE